MPELPEVETTLRGIEPFVDGKTLTKVCVRETRLRWPVPKAALARLCGQRVVSMERRAKYILINFDKATILLHLGMSGSLRVLPRAQSPDKHDHIDLEFDEQHIIRLNDPRRFGCCLALEPPLDQHALLANLGPEPLEADFGGNLLFRRSRGRKQAVKNFIMDGKVVVGVGNIYASESLFKAGIRPGTAAGRISKKRYELLASAIKEVLGKAILAGGTTLNDFTQADGKPGYFRHELQVYARDNEPCHQCGTKIRSKVLGQRNTFYCPSCQRY